MAMVTETLARKFYKSKPVDGAGRLPQWWMRGVHARAVMGQGGCGGWRWGRGTHRRRVAVSRTLLGVEHEWPWAGVSVRGGAGHPHRG